MRSVVAILLSFSLGTFGLGQFGSTASAELSGSPRDNLFELCIAWKNSTQRGLAQNARDWVAIWDRATIYNTIAYGVMYPEVWDSFWNPTYGYKSLVSNGWMSPRMAKILRMHESAITQELNKCLSDPKAQKEFMLDLEEVSFRIMLYVVLVEVGSIVNMAKLGSWVIARLGIGAWTLLKAALTFATYNFGSMDFWRLFVTRISTIASSTAITQMLYPLAFAFSEKVRKGELDPKAAVDRAGDHLEKINEKTSVKPNAQSNIEHLLRKLRSRQNLTEIEARGLKSLLKSGYPIELTPQDLAYLRGEVGRYGLQ